MDTVDRSHRPPAFPGAPGLTVAVGYAMGWANATARPVGRRPPMNFTGIHEHLAEGFAQTATHGLCRLTGNPPSLGRCRIPDQRRKCRCQPIHQQTAAAMKQSSRPLQAAQESRGRWRLRA